MQGSLRLHVFSSACVHAIESSDDGSHPSPRSAIAATSGEDATKKTNTKRAVTRLLLPLKHTWRISQAFRSLSRGAKNEAAATTNNDGESDDVETFVSATSSELHSSSCTDNDRSEPPSFRRLIPLIIFPTGSLERRRPPAAPASPVKIVQKLPFGYVIGRQPDAAPVVSPTTLERNVKKVVPMMAALHLRSRSQAVKKKVTRALKGTFRQGSRGGADEGSDVDEDVFWKDVRGLRCRRVEDDDAVFFSRTCNTM